MWIEIEHRTRFSYDRPVLLEPLDIRLRPRANARQALSRFALEITPRPAGVDEHEDLFENGVTRVWFEGWYEALTILCRATVETRCVAFSGLPDPAALRLPFAPPLEMAAALAPFSTRSAPDPAVTELATSWVHEVGGDTIAFLSLAALRLHEQWRPLPRLEGDPWPAGVTLLAGEGSCRDLAVLYLDICRAAGLAARFVSGYHARAASSGAQTLHAWAEVYLPGAGWLGFDPSEGLAVSDRHVPVAAGPNPRDAAPTKGTFRGTGASSTLAWEVRLSAREEPPPGP